MQKTPRFLDLYHAGEVADGEINDYIDAWHARDSNVQLHVHLGMTWTEYQQWCALAELPSEAEHLRVPQVDHVLVGPCGKQTAMCVHGPSRCRPACPVHWPSDHPQAGWPLGWLEDVGVMTRLCRHDRHHPDPDDQQVRLHPELAEHDCCGCCMITIEGEYEDDRPAPEIQSDLRHARKAIAARRSEKPA